MYFGGWDNPGQTHDNIYRAECPVLGSCQGAALLLDSAALGFEHLNDPSVLLLWPRPNLGGNSKSENSLMGDGLVV